MIGDNKQQGGVEGHGVRELARASSCGALRTL